MSPILTGMFFEDIYSQLENDFKLGVNAHPVDTGHWQAMSDVPQVRTWEIQNAVMPIYVPQTLTEMVEHVKPNLPWADMHFDERVSGIPYNPPPSAEHWPFAQKKHADHVDDQSMFSHTYPERMWSRNAGFTSVGVSGRLRIGGQNEGIRYRYGDLDDLISLLKREPYTRQAYLPIWFPEDTGAHAGQRVPCSLGYHFMYRRDKLSCTYLIRSCDFLRHFRDDVYMAMRLMRWVADEAGLSELGDLLMHVPSMHIFQGDSIAPRQ